MKCVILQPSFLPWRGYFHQIQKADVFIFFDDVQYDKHGWRNRNRIKTANGSAWLTIPVLSKGAVSESHLIHSVRMDTSPAWRRKHLASIEQSYRKAPYFERYWPLLENAYGRDDTLLADLTIALTIELAKELGIGDRNFLRSSELAAEGRKTEKLLHLCQTVRADHYISGPSARSYLDASLLEAEGISVEYMNYDYPEYEQLHPPFDPQVSVLDLLMMKGPEAGELIWGPQHPKPKEVAGTETASNTDAMLAGTL